MAISARLTYEQSLELPENKFEEIVDGEIRLRPPPGRVHALLIERLAEILREQLDRTVFRILTSPFGQGIKRKPYLSYRVPDLAVYRAEHLDRERDHYVWSAPELIIECLSPANRKGSVDQLLQDYASIQVPEVWLLYPEERMLRRWALETDGYRQAPTDIATASPLRLSTVRIDVNEIWKLLPAGS
jgi:Uma2 family endonuclease